VTIKKQKHYNGCMVGIGKYIYVTLGKLNVGGFGHAYPYPVELMGDHACVNHILGLACY